MQEVVGEEKMKKAAGEVGQKEKNIKRMQM